MTREKTGLVAEVRGRRLRASAMRGHSVPREEHGNLGFGCPASRDPQDKLGEFLVRRVEGHVIQLEKDERRSESCTLVSIQEGMVPGEVEEIGSRHFERRSVQKATSE